HTVWYTLVERFCRILATMAAAGVALPEALRVASDSVRNRVFVRSLARVGEAMMEGEGLARPLAATGLFPATAVRMMRVGEDARAGPAARDYADAAGTWVAAGHSDAGTSPASGPPTVQYTAPSGYRASDVSVSCWDGALWKPCAQAQKGLEQLTVQVYDGTDA